MSSRELLAVLSLFAATGAIAKDDQFSLADVHLARDKYSSCVSKQSMRLDDKRSEPATIIEGARSACGAERKVFVLIVSLWLTDEKPETSEQEALRRAERLSTRFDEQIRPETVRKILESRRATGRVR